MSRTAASFSRPFVSGEDEPTTLTHEIPVEIFTNSLPRVFALRMVKFVLNFT